MVDSTPVTAMMVKVLDSFAQNQSLNLPIKPIVFALAFGPTLGANGSLYGASSNILCAGVAEKLGHKITCSQYFKYIDYFICYLFLYFIRIFFKK